jgi:hypothetical protein
MVKCFLSGILSKKLFFRPMGQVKILFMDVKLDPLTTVVRLAFINYKKGPIKLGILPSGLALFDDSWLDRGRRTLQHWLGNGCSREFLFTLRPALEQAVVLFHSRYAYLLDWAYLGLTQMQNIYAYSNVAETITLAMRTLKDPPRTDLVDVRSPWSDAELDAVVVLMKLLQQNPRHVYIMDSIDVLLNGKAAEFMLVDQPKGTTENFNSLK